ncbi:MAG: outer membrane beta-barrel protein [Marinilabiliaceae bacterium]
MGIGLRCEHVIYDFLEDQTKSDLESKVYNNIFPTLSFSSAIGQVNYGFDYHIRTIRPAYEMLKSAVNYGSRLTYMSGTPSLQPTYIHEGGGNRWSLHASWQASEHMHEIFRSSKHEHLQRMDERQV